MEAVASARTRQRAAPWLLRWHRRAGIVACIGILLWAASGISHPLMSRMQPRPAAFAPPMQDLRLDQAKPLADILSTHRIAHVDWVRVVAWPAGTYYQVALPGQRELAYFAVTDGQRLERADRAYAEFLARHYLGDASASVLNVEPVTAFDDEYTYINRLLPAYRVRFDRPDGMRVYVDTASSRLGTLVDTTKARLSAFFRTLHTWSFLDAFPGLRIAVMLPLLSSALAAALMGIWLYVARYRSYRANGALRRGHRIVGILVSVSTLAFSVSGGYHLLKTSGNPASGPSPQDTGFEARDFSLHLSSLAIAGEARTIRAVSCARIDGETYYRVVKGDMRHAPTHGGHHGHGSTTGPDRAGQVVLIHATTGRTLSDGDPRHIASLARTFGGAGERTFDAQTPVTRYGGEYGFVFKRLPVTRVTLENGVRYYIDASSGTLAARIDDGDALEGWVFAYLHKFEWLGAPLARDIAGVLFALGNATVAMLGLMLFRRVQRTARARDR